MDKANKSLQRIVIQISLTVIILYVAYEYPRSEFFNLGLWLFAFLFVISTVYDTLNLLNCRKQADHNSSLHGHLYWTILGVTLMWAVAIFILGINNLIMNKIDLVIIFSTILIVFLIPSMFIGFKWLARVTKDPYRWLGIFLPMLQVILLMQVSATTINLSEGSTTLFELAARYPSNYPRISLYLLFIIILIGTQLTDIARTRWGAILSMILAFTVHILHWSIALEYGWKTNEIGIWLLLPSIILGVLMLVSQSFWTDYYWKHSDNYARACE